MKLIKHINPTTPEVILKALKSLRLGDEIHVKNHKFQKIKKDLFQKEGDIKLYTIKQLCNFLLTIPNK